MIASPDGSPWVEACDCFSSTLCDFEIDLPQEFELHLLSYYAYFE